MSNTRTCRPHMDNYVCDLTTCTQLDAHFIVESPSVQLKSCCFYSKYSQKSPETIGRQTTAQERTREGSTHSRDNQTKT